MKNELHQLLDSLPTSIERHQIHDTDLGISYVEASPFYVAPTLTVERSLDDLTRVAIIVAPAAVGKSTMAAEIAFAKSAPILDLSNVQVGHNTFSDALMNAFGYAAGPTILGSLQKGDGLVVVDALDEAEIRAGDKNFQVFIQELCRFARTVENQPSLVLLARSETAEWIQLVFDDEAVPLARYTIDFFGKPEADEFVGKKLSQLYANKGASERHEIYSKPHREALELLYGKIYKLTGLNGYRRSSLR